MKNKAIEFKKNILMVDAQRVPMLWMLLIFVIIAVGVFTILMQLWWLILILIVGYFYYK